MRRGNIEAERARLDMTQDVICKELKIGKQTFQRFINGDPIPSDKLEKMAQMFGVTVDYLLQPTESWRPVETA